MPEHTTAPTGQQGTQRAQRDLVMLGVALAAVILFVGIGGTVMAQTASAWLGHAAPPDPTLTSALLLNIALVIFGWRRYADLEREVVERRKAEAQARQLAETDALTGCYNRRSIIQAAGELIQTMDTRTEAVAVLMVDLDNFKQINDLYGHRVGDGVLVCAVRRLRETLPADAVLARIGGDELAGIVIYDRTDRDGLEELAGRLISELARPQSHGADVLEVTVSAGIGLLEKVSAEQQASPAGLIGPLLHQADIAMYHAKQTGRNSYAVFDPAMEQQVRLRNRIEAGIRQGIRRGEFVPFYEQQIDVETGQLVGFEMLARWQSSELGNMGPDVFIPVAEEMGAIQELSESLIRQALDDARHWPAQLTLAVNISPVQLRDPWFAQRLLKLLTETGFPPARLEVEITENALQGNLAQIRSTMMSLRNQGIRISLDDFGTGYSNLARLGELPFDQIKIDRSLVMDLTRKADSQAIVKSIISLGRGLDLPLVVEGIENPEVLAALRKLGRFKGQGYLYGRPENAASTRARLSEAQVAPLAGATQPAPSDEGLSAREARDLARQKLG